MNLIDQDIYPASASTIPCRSQKFSIEAFALTGPALIFIFSSSLFIRRANNHITMVMSIAVTSTIKTNGRFLLSMAHRE